MAEIFPLSIHGSPTDDEVAAITSAYMTYLHSCTSAVKDADPTGSLWQRVTSLQARQLQGYTGLSWTIAHRLQSRQMGK